MIKFSMAQNQKRQLLLKIANPLKSAFSPEPLDILAEVLYRALVGP